ncbi:hypothetical protein GCM10020218_106160 [Dactylosporangium vinaceum]
MAGGVAAFTAVAAAAAQLAFAATLFSDNFEDGDTGGWSKSGGTWAVVSDGSKVLSQSSSGSENAREFAGDAGWTNYTVSARVKPASIGSGGHAALLARASSSTTFYRLALLSGSVQLQAVNSGSVTVLGQVSRTVSTGTWYTLSLSVSGSTIAGSVDGTSVGSATNSSVAKGRIGVQTVYAAAAFDDVTVSDTAGPTPTTTGPGSTASPTKSPTPTPTPTPTGTGGGGSTPTGAWPTSTGSVTVSGTISVSGTLDGGLKRYCCIGDGGQSESQDPMFELADGATLKNVIIGSPAGDGVHCLGRCTIQNVWWEDVGEDAATFLGTSGGDSYVIGGGARSATDKVFQHNGNGTVHISDFYASGIGKLYRGCGNCTNHYERHVVVDNVLLVSTKYVVGINTNWGDTATLTRVVVQSSSGIHICAEYTGVAKGSEPKYLGDGQGDGHCNFSASDITYK